MPKGPEMNAENEADPLIEAKRTGQSKNLITRICYLKASTSF